MNFRCLRTAMAVLAIWVLGQSAAIAKCELSIIATLPVTMQGLRPLVPAKINGKDVMLMADSGAFFSLISTAAATELKLAKSPLPGNIRVEGVAGSADSWMTRVKDFELAGIPLHWMEFLVASSVDDGGAGLLGQNILGFADVEYDLPHGVIRLLRVRDCDGVALAYWAKDKSYAMVRIDRPEPSRPHTRAEVQLNGKTFRAMFDTGAGITVVSRRAAAAAGVKVGDPGVEDLGVVGGVGGATTRLWYARFNSFKLGDEEVRNVKLHISDRLGDDDMLVGADFFISHRILVANHSGRLFLTYEGGPVFSSAAEARERSADGKTERKVDATLTAEAEPTTADGYARRGMAALSRNQSEPALSDLTRAIALAPMEPRYLVERAQVHAHAGRSALALADLDSALRLKADNPPALLARASLKLGGRDAAGAMIDLDQASQVLPRESDARLILGELYGAAGRPDLTLAQMNQWLETHPDSAEARLALTDRCHARALLGIDLDKAAQDCDRAVWLAPRTAPPLDGRGLVNLRRQKWQAAVDDYSAALAIDPKLAWSLYGRGVARRHLGKASDGEADIKAALALEPGLAEQVKRYGINAEAPPSSP